MESHAAAFFTISVGQPIPSLEKVPISGQVIQLFRGDFVISYS